MLKFRPIVMSESDMQAFKYISGTVAQEGTICEVYGGDLNSVSCRMVTAAVATLDVAATTGNGTLSAALQSSQGAGTYFPIYRENPDVENIGATINQNDYVIGFFGQEFEVHKTLCVPGTLSSWTTADAKVNITTSGKYCLSTNATVNTGVVIGRVIATFNGTWLRIRRVN